MQNEGEDRELRRQLEDLPREVAPPPELEMRTRVALRRVGLLRAPTSSHGSRAFRVLAAAALLLATFVAGRATRSVPATPQATHALLLYGGATTSDADHDARAEEYRNWVTAAHTAARVLGGEALADGGSPLGGASSQSLRVGDEQDPIVGFFLVQAATQDAAAALAKTCPHLKYGRVVVKRILPT